MSLLFYHIIFKPYFLAVQIKQQKLFPHFTLSTNEWQFYHQIQKEVTACITSHTFKGGRMGTWQNIILSKNSSVCATWHCSTNLDNVNATSEHMPWFGKNCSVYITCHRSNLIKCLIIFTCNGHYLKQSVSPDLHLCNITEPPFLLLTLPFQY